MQKQAILSAILEIGVVPVVRTSSAETAVLAIEAIYRGGIRAAEVTMTVPGAIRALETLADKFGDKIVLGAGTVLDPETARACMLAGAQFFVTPALNVKTIEMAHRYSKPIMPGALTPTEVLAAWDAGASIVKVFPCGAVGGPKYIRALKGPFPQIEMIPTGGVNLERLVVTRLLIERHPNELIRARELARPDRIALQPFDRALRHGNDVQAIAEAGMAEQLLEVLQFLQAPCRLDVGIVHEQEHGERARNVLAEGLP